MCKTEKEEKSASLRRRLHKYLYTLGKAFCRHMLFIVLFFLQ